MQGPLAEMAGPEPQRDLPKTGCEQPDFSHPASAAVGDGSGDDRTPAPDNNGAQPKRDLVRRSRRRKRHEVEVEQKILWELQRRYSELSASAEIYSMQVGNRGVFPLTAMLAVKTHTTNWWRCSSKVFVSLSNFRVICNAIVSCNTTIEDALCHGCWHFCIAI